MKNTNYQTLEPTKPNLIPSEAGSNGNPDAWISYFKMKLEALIWVGIFAITFHKTEFVKQIFTNKKVTFPFLVIFVVCIGINTSICVFILYLKFIRKYQDYDSYSGYITPFSAIFGFIGFLSLIIAIFPIYGFLSLIVVPILGFGFMMFSHFIPFKGELNTFTHFLLMIGLIYVGYTCY